MKVVLNPRMNDRIKAGQARVSDMMEYGISPYLGTDGEASNDDLSITGEKMFISSRYPEISENLIGILSSLPFKFKNGYIGGIEPGNFCDFKVTKNGRVYDVFAGGERVVKNGELLKLNINRDIEDKLRKSVKDLFIY
jgi:5-methylthioadenosine/S-adenosylhomocysteine deaminase